jgi:hypothetical protein
MTQNRRQMANQNLQFKLTNPYYECADGSSAFCYLTSDFCALDTDT